jgi:hypothetical protein
VKVQGAAFVKRADARTAETFGHKFKLRVVRTCENDQAQI